MWKIRQCLNQPIVEQVCLYASVFVYCFSIGIYAAIIPNFIQHKVCSPEASPDLNRLCNDTSKLLEATDIITTRGMIREAVPVIILLLAGIWRDITGQNKPLIYSALVGEVIGVSVLLLASWKWSISIWTASIAEAILYGLFGGNKVFYVAATCAVTDQSDERHRTMRLMYYQVAAYAATCLSSAISGYSLHLLGYTWFFVMVLALHLLTNVLIAFSKDDEHRIQSGEKHKILHKMKAITKSRPNNSVLWIMLISCVVINVCSLAENNLYLYYLQLMFAFTVKEAGVYSAFRQMISVISTIILSPVFTKILKWSDFRIGILSSLMTFVAAILMIYAKTIVQLIAFAFFDFLKIFVHTLPMVIVTKCVKSHEIGIFVSLRFVGGCLSPMLVFYIYDVIFSATSHRMPGAFFMASAMFTLLVFFSFWISYCIYKEPTELLEKDSTTSIEVEKRRSGDISENNGTIDKF